MFEKEKPLATGGFDAAPVLPNLTVNALKVLRLCKGGDVFRDKGRGQSGRAARLKSLEGLRELGLLRITTTGGFWRLTARGKEVLLANPPTRRLPKR